MPIDPALHELVASQDVEQIATGFQFTEGPVWHPDGYLLFSDLRANRIWKWTPPDRLEVFREQSGGPGSTPASGSNGLALDRQRRLIVCEHGNRRVTRTEPDGSITVLADRYQGKRLNSPNDVVVRSDGLIYFTDPPYGVRPEERELDIQGVFCITHDGNVVLVADDFDRPNGLVFAPGEPPAFSPFESVLYIADTARRHVRRFKVAREGTLQDGEVFAELHSDMPGAPDGMTVDTRGHLFVAGPGGIWVFDSSGNHLGTILTPEVPANCAFGGPQGTTLFITARTSVYRLEMRIPGVP